MTLRRAPVVIVWLCLGVSPVPAIAQGIDVEKIVAAHYPDRLKPDTPRDRHSCAKVLDAGPNGVPLRIAAGYTDTNEAMFRVLERVPSGSFTVAYESPKDLAMFGLFCEVRLADLDGDGSADVLFELASRGSLTWVFRRTSTGVAHITPTYRSYGMEYSELNNAGVVDLYHDGTRQIATVGSGPPEKDGDRVTHLPQIYKMRGGSLVLDAEVLLIADFRPGDDFTLRTSEFNLKVGDSGEFEIRITNGERGGRRRVTSLSLRLNGAELPGATTLTDRVEFLDIPITQPLKDQNTLVATVGGPAGAKVQIVIRKR